MKIIGSLCSHLCEDCKEPLNGMEVLLYLPWKRENRTDNVKDSFHIVSKDEAAEREKLFIDRVFTDDNGNFEFNIDQRYSEMEFDVDFICGNVPRGPKRNSTKEQLQIHLATISPVYDQKDNYIYNWHHCIAHKWWCYIRGHFFDAWVICGHLRNCQTGRPIADASVTAWDADFLTDDNLGTTTTDNNGHFRIDYNSSTFKRTFLSPWINAETDPGPGLNFQSGPDVYFKAELGGLNLINETKSDSRKNVGYCLCVNLCTKINVTDGDNGDTFPSAWTGIGSAFSSSFGTNSYDFDVDGYAGTGKYALSGVVRLTGQAALKSSSGNRIEYRFRVSDVTTNNGTPSPAIANFTKTVGVTTNLFASSVVAKLTKKMPTGTNDDLFVYSDQTDFDADGWFDANNAIERTLLNAGFTTSDLNLFWIIDEDTLISINTAALTSAANVPNSAPGVPIAAANKIPIEKFALRFEIREVVDKANNIFNVIPGNGKTLNSVIMNNNPVFMKLSITELEAGLCNPISGTLHAKYTVYHPHLVSSSLHLHNNSNSVNRYITGDGFLTLSNNTNPLIDGNANSSIQLNNPPNDMTRCTYALNLYARARLHNGENAWSDSGPITQLFFYDV